jgi:hypothetical protein
MFVAVTSYYNVAIFIPVYYGEKIIYVKNMDIAHLEHKIN